MIHCRLADAARYAALHPLFSRAFALAGDQGVRQRPAGSYDLGDGLRVNVDAGMTEPAAQRRFESHRAAIDIQVVLAGPEAMAVCHVTDLVVSEPFTEAADIAFYTDPSVPVQQLIVAPEEVAIFFPEDAHKPCCHPGSEALPFRKLVFKVPVG